MPSTNNKFQTLPGSFINPGLGCCSINKSLLEEIDLILYKAYEEKTIPPAHLHELKENYKNNINGLREVLEKMSDNRTDFLNKMSWAELEQNMMLEEFEKRDFEAFKKKYKQQFGRDYLPTNIH